MGYHELILDASIRDWVFIPLTFFIVLMKLLMQYAHNITNATPVTTTELTEIREQAAVQRSQVCSSTAGLQIIRLQGIHAQLDATAHYSSVHVLRDLQCHW